jgi:hemerythrin
MALIDWDESFSVKVSEIDGEHRKIIDMINELHEAMLRKQGREVLTRIIEGLVAYAATHFKTEESYFARFGYPDAKSHIKEHGEFTRKISEFKAAFDSGKLGLSIDVIHYMDEWITNHIKVVDKKYSQFFNSHGLA